MKIRFSRLVIALTSLWAHAEAAPEPGNPDVVPKGLVQSDWQSIRAEYEAGRHAFAPVDGGWQARNPGQQWTTTFDGRGFMAEPHDGGWQWGLELQSYGFPGAERTVGDEAVVRADGQRLTYDWDASVQEWFVNDTRGLEHGFTVRERPTEPDFLTGHADLLPSSALPASPLCFLLATRGELIPVIAPDAQSVFFQDAGGATVLNYSGLKVLDADGKVLASRFEAAAENSVRLLVEEHGARYPLTIDPIAQQAYLKASNTGAGDSFGSSVAVSGNTVVVGARWEDSNATGVNGNQTNNSSQDSGAAYVFVRSGTTWTQQAYLKASNTRADDSFGSSVAVSGNTVVVGAFLEKSNATGVNGNQADDSAGNAGAAYVFTRSGTVWTQQAYLKASNTGENDFFGWSVAVSGDTAAVGAYQEDSSTTGVNSTPNNPDMSFNSGAAYVFVRNGTTWTQQAYLKASNTDGRDFFGWSVAVSGDTVVVGAYSESSNATGVNGSQANNLYSGGSGAAYVFTRSGTTWTQQAYLKASNTEANDYFGWSVAVSGETAVIGAKYEDSNTTGVNSTPADAGVYFNSGAAYVFVRSGVDWAQQAYLKASNTGLDDHFGESVAVSGDTLVVGSHLESNSATGVNGNQTAGLAGGAGAAYVFTRRGSNWTQQAYLKASNTEANDYFGKSVGLSGDTVVVGAWWESSSTTGINSTPNESASGAGAAYVFTGLGPPPPDADNDGLLDSWELSHWPTITGHSAQDDFDGDGYVELLELALGLNPKTPDPGGLPTVTVENGYLTMTITKQPGVTYEVQSAGTLLEGQPDSFSPASTNVFSNATTLTARDTIPVGTAPRRFMRVKVTAAP